MTIDLLHTPNHWIPFPNVAEEHVTRHTLTLAHSGRHPEDDRLVVSPMTNTASKDLASDSTRFSVHLGHLAAAPPDW